MQVSSKLNIMPKKANDTEHYGTIFEQYLDIDDFEMTPRGFVNSMTCHLLSWASEGRTTITANALSLFWASREAGTVLPDDKL